VALLAAPIALALALVAAQPAEGATARTTDLFFVQNANSARLVPLGGGRFDLVARWDRGESFRRTPPNAALEGVVGGRRRPVTVFLEGREPLGHGPARRRPDGCQAHRRDDLQDRLDRRHAPQRQLPVAASAGTRSADPCSSACVRCRGSRG
jgi:hypothetical protein